MSRAHEALYEIARDLTTLEINTVLKEHMTALKMPPVPTALRDIIDGYERELRTLLDAGAVDEPLAALTCNTAARHGNGGFDFASDGELDVDALIGDFQTLHQLARRAIGADGTAAREWLRRDRPVEPLEAARRLRRVHRSCTQILDILGHAGAATGKAAALDLGYREMIELRKIWDLGTEEVVAQTVIQLDGDVLTRISKAHATDAFLLQVHEDSTKTAIRMWTGLIDTVVSFFGALAGRVETKARQP